VLVSFVMHGTPPIAPKELEVKLELDPASLPALHKIPLLRARKTTPKRSSEVSVYFDTDKHKLRKKGLMLRVRRKGGRYIQTIKAAGNSGPFERDEWETEIAGKEPDLNEANGTALEPLLSNKLRRRLKPLFETRVRRTVYPVVDEECAIAFTVDHGTVDTGSRSLPLCEIELELERGTLAELFEVARQLVRVLPARLALKSKSQRGYEIIDGDLESPVKATSIDLPARIKTRDAFKMIGLDCLKQVINNEAALISGNSEGVHQMRIGLRRLRAAMSLFSALLRSSDTAEIKAELKWLTGELGPARELEVLVSRIAAPMKKQRRRWAGMPSLSRELAERRDAAFMRAQDAVRSDRFRALTLDTAAWLQAGRWMNPRDDLVRDRGDPPITVFAAEQLTRRWRKVRKKALAQLDARGRHKLRIQAKKLRYAAEFFVGLFAGKRKVKRRKQFLDALGRLQDGLGDLNDIVVHEKRIAAIGIRRQRSNPSRAFAAGLLTGLEDARTEAAMTAAVKAHADLEKIKRFWR
jgi:inorganic triphosphatase YgiF